MIRRDEAEIEKEIPRRGRAGRQWDLEYPDDMLNVLTFHQKPSTVDVEVSRFT